VAGGLPKGGPAVCLDDAPAQLPQHVGRRRLLSAPLEQPDEHRDARDRLAQVVRDDVGEITRSASMRR